MGTILIFLILAIPLVAAYAMYAVGIVAIYRASRVLNLAHGAMATVPAFITYTLAVKLRLPVIPSAFVGLIAGALLGILIERIFVRRLRRISPTAQTVGTVAAFGLCISFSAKIWGTAGLNAPHVFPDKQVEVLGVSMRTGQLGLFGVAVAATVGLFLLFGLTEFGLAMRGAAQNRRAASLMGINPDLTTTAAWAIGGALAGMAGVLLAPITTLNPYILSLSVLPAFVAALLGGLENLPGSLAGAAVVGLLMAVVPVLAELPIFRPVLGQLGGPEFAMAVLAMFVMALRGQRFAVADVRAEVL